MAKKKRETIKFKNDSDFLTAVLGCEYNCDIEEGDEEFEIIEDDEDIDDHEKGIANRYYTLQRKSDGKFFSASFRHHHWSGSYIIDDRTLIEVFKKTRTVTTYE